jgi:valyl-tRNA synthetase
MIFSRLELLGEVPFRRDHPRPCSPATGGGCRSASARNRRARGDRAARRRCEPVQADQDVLDPGRRFSDGFLEEGRKLANKLWNVSRLILANVGEETPAERPSSLEERWILARLSASQRQIEAAFVELDFAEVASTLYHVTFDDFCDWYAEAIKPGYMTATPTRGRRRSRRSSASLKLLHPVMPHVTEEIWSNLPARESR